MSKNRGNSQRIQHRRGSAAEWTANNPILFAGELGYETDTTRIKVGDGVTQWVNLAYVGQFGANDLDGLTDVSITSPASGAVLRYDGTSWIDAVLSKSDVGLSNVDNTSDANKPVSTAQATANAAVASAASSDATSKANAAQAAAIQRSNHTGTQPASTITGLAASATTDTTNAANIGSGVLPAARLPAATATTVGGVVIGSGLGVASGTVSVTYGTASGTACQGNDARLSDARVPTSHTHTVSQVTDAGTIATQNANSVAITGGSINGTTIGATTASTGVFTAVTVIGAGDAGFGAVTTGGNIAHVTLQNQATGGRSYSMRAWGSAGSGAFGIDDLTANARRFTIDSTGNVGIGTASPGAKLHVAGSGQGIFIEDTGANRAVLGLYAFNNELRIQGTAYVNAAQPLTVWTANAERMRIDANGNVGIGTNSPSARLDVRTNTANDGIILASSTSNLQIRALNGQGANNGIVQANDSGIIYTGGTVNTGAFVIAPWNNATCGLRMDANGNVGVGVASPTARLDVRRTNTYALFCDSVFVTAAFGPREANDGFCTVTHSWTTLGSGNYWQTDYSSGGYQLSRQVGATRTEMMTVLSSGNVGIGTTSPGSRLEVIHSGGQGINCLNNGGAGTVNYAVMAQAAGVAGANTGLYVNCFNASSNYGIRIVAPSNGANNWAIYSDATAQSYFAGNVGIGTASPTISSGVGLHLSGSTLRLGTARTPASSTATGNQGEVCWDSSYLYVCIATNTWRRIALTTW